MPRALLVNYFVTFVKNTNLLVLLLRTSCFLDILYSLTSVLHCCTQLMKLKFKFNSELQLSFWNLITSHSSRSLSKVTPPLTENLCTKYSARHNITFNPLKIGITTLIIVNCCQRRVTACSGSQDWLSSLPLLTFYKLSLPWFNNNNQCPVILKSPSPMQASFA